MSDKKKSPYCRIDQLTALEVSEVIDNLCGGHCSMEDETKKQRLRCLQTMLGDETGVAVWLMEKYAFNHARFNNAETTDGAVTSILPIPMKIEEEPGPKDKTFKLTVEGGLSKESLTMILSVYKKLFGYFGVFQKIINKLGARHQQLVRVGETASAFGSAIQKAKGVRKIEP